MSVNPMMQHIISPVLPQYDSLEWNGDVIRLDNATDEQTWFLTPESIVGWHVDWVPHGGIITVALNNGRMYFTVVFEEIDAGKACSEALNDLDKMRAVLRDRKERTP